MIKHKKSYPDEFKLSKEYGVAIGTIYNWIKLYSDVDFNDDKKMVKEYQEMKKRNIELEMKIEALITTISVLTEK